MRCCWARSAKPIFCPPPGSRAISARIASTNLRRDRFQAWRFDVEFGLGYGLTSGSDRVVAKAIIGYDFPVPGATSHGADSGPKLPLTMKAPPRQTGGNILNYSASPL